MPRGGVVNKSIWDPPIMLPGVQPQGLPRFPPVNPAWSAQNPYLQRSDQSAAITKLEGCCGYEVANSTVYAPIGGQSVLSQAGGATVAFDTSIFRSPGHQSLSFSKTDVNAAIHSIVFANSGVRGVARGYFYVDVLPSTATGIAFQINNLATTQISVQITTAGDCQLKVGAAAAASLMTLTAARWYRLDIKWDLGQNPWTATACITEDLTLASSGDVTATNPVSAATFDRIRVGCCDSNVHTWGCHWDDIGYQTGSTLLYPIGPGYVVLQAPTGVGTHFRPGSFQDHTGAALTSGDTTSYQEIDDPGTAIDTTTYVVQTGEVTFNAPFEWAAPYLEYTLPTPSHSSGGIATPNDVPRCVNAIVAMAGGTASTNRTEQTWIVDALDAYESIINRSSITGTGLSYFNKMLPSSPGGRLWTDAEIAGLRIRYGYGNNAAGAHRFSFAGIEVEYVGAIRDAGSANVTLTPSTPNEVLSDAVGQTTGSSGTLSNSGTREALTADIVWLEPYTFTDYVSVVQYQWQYKGTNGATEHWKLVVYDNSGPGGSPGQLYYVSAEQTIVVPGAATQTASLSPTDLSLPPGTWYIGEHLKEANLAPTYQAHAGTTYDASDTYADGPNQTFSGAVSGDNLRDKLITYTVNLAVTLTPTHSAAIVEPTGSANVTLAPSEVGAFAADAGSDNITGTPVGSGETIVDAGSASLTLTPSSDEVEIDGGADTVSFTVSGAEAIADQASDAVSLTPAGGDALVDVGAEDVAFIDSAAEALVDQAADDVLFTTTASYEVVTGDVVVDSGSDTVSFTPTDAEAICDSGTAALALTPTGTQVLADAGAAVASFTVSRASETIAETEAATSVVVTSGAEAVTSSGAGTVTFTATGQDAIRETASDRVTFTVSGSFIRGDAGVATVVFTPTGDITTWIDAGAVTLVSTPTAAEALVDQGGGDATLTPVGSDAIADAGADDVEVVPDGSISVSITDTGTITVGSDAGSLEAIADATDGAVVFTVAGIGRRVLHYGRVATNVAGLVGDLDAAVANGTVDVTVVRMGSVVCTITTVNPLDATVQTPSVEVSSQ